MAKRTNPMSQLTEFYSKVCVARSVKFVTDEASIEEDGVSEGDRFSRSLATILARDREVVAVNLKILPNKCRVYISKNDDWLDRDVEYLDEIKGLLTNLSKNAPMKFAQAAKSDDFSDLFSKVLKYCSVKLGRRLVKLKRNIRGKEDRPYIKSFLEFLESYEIDVDNLDEVNECDITVACCGYYKINKNEEYPQRFLGHIKKVGSYSASVMDIVNCARKEKHKPSFSCIDLHLLDPIRVDQPISPWKDIVAKFIPNQKNLEEFKKNCLKNSETKKRLCEIYGGTGSQLDRETTNHIYLHAELNILTNTDVLSKEYNEFIAVSKKCCYLCESYINFLRSKGYKITVSGAHKNLYHRWMLPDTYEEFVENALRDLDEIIESGIGRHTKITAKSDSDGESADSDNPEGNYLAMMKEACKGVKKKLGLIPIYDSDIQ